MIKVVVIEAGDNYLEPRETFDLEVPKDEKEAMRVAMSAVAQQGYKVMTDAEGGCNEVCNDGYGRYIVVTVFPENS